MYGLIKDSKLTEVFEKSDNPDMVYKYSVVREEIYLRGTDQSLENQIKRLDDQIAQAKIPPAPVAMIPTTEMEKQKTELQDLADKLKKI